VKRRAPRRHPHGWRLFAFRPPTGNVIELAPRILLLRHGGGVLATACVVAAVVGVANHFGYGPFTTFPLSHHNEPFMPGDRTCSGGAYTFQIPGAFAVQDNVAIPMAVASPDSGSDLTVVVQT
jgi:hypothetical protein